MHGAIDMTKVLVQGFGSGDIVLMRDWYPHGLSSATMLRSAAPPSPGSKPWTGRSLARPPVANLSAGPESGCGPLCMVR
jgi:hypothetical protein